MTSASDDLVSRLDDHGRRLDALEASERKYMSAFPSGDLDGHRRYHELKMEELEERRRLRRTIQEKTISGLVWAGILFLAVSVWRYLLSLIFKAN